MSTVQDHKKKSVSVFVVNKKFLNFLQTRFDEFVEEVGLTDREAEVCMLLLKGLSYNEVAEVLGMAVTSVKTHSTQIYSKAGCTNRAELGHTVFPL